MLFRSVQGYGFTKVFGIELNEGLFNICKDNTKELENVTVYLGESPDILQMLCSNLNEHATFWLDAHVSGESMPGGKYGASPLLHELDAINLSSCKEHVIIIDDIRLLDTAEWEYLKKQDVINKLYEINSNYNMVYVDGHDDGRFPDDILIAYI